MSAGYGAIPVVRDVEFVVRSGEVVALVGPNGAGKTTTLRAVCGLIRPVAGKVRWKGDSTKKSLYQLARSGLGYVAEERSVFMQLTVEENLRVGRCSEDRVMSLFPELEARRRVRAGLLSGGEQQMLVLGRALAREPDLLVIDELSLGLAPLMVSRLFLAVRAAVDAGTAVLLVEQQLRQAFAASDVIHVLSGGRQRLSGPARELECRMQEIEDSYLSSSIATDDTRGGPWQAEH